MNIKLEFLILLIFSLYLVNAWRCFTYLILIVMQEGAQPTYFWEMHTAFQRAACGLHAVVWPPYYIALLMFKVVLENPYFLISSLATCRIYYWIFLFSHIRFWGFFTPMQLVLLMHTNFLQDQTLYQFKGKQNFLHYLSLDNTDLQWRRKVIKNFWRHNISFLYIVSLLPIL